MPKTWPLARKDKKFVIFGKGASKQERSLPLLVILRDLLRVVATRSEAKKILKDGLVLINSKSVKDERFNVGLFDRIEIKRLEKFFTVHFTEKGKLTVVEIDKEQSETKPCKIIGKCTLSKDKQQINCEDGRNFIALHKEGVENFRVGDTLIVELKTNKIKGLLKLEKGAFVLITRGRNAGKHGKIEELKEKLAIVKIEDKTVSVPKQNLIALEEKEFRK